MNDKSNKRWKIPPPYSYDLAMWIDPNWKRTSVRVPFICRGIWTGHHWVRCDNEPVWWHPHVSINYYYCDHCCTDDYKKWLHSRWRETKMYLLTKQWISEEPRKSLLDYFGVEEESRNLFCELAGLFTWNGDMVKEASISFLKKHVVPSFEAIFEHPSFRADRKDK